MTSRFCKTLEILTCVWQRLPEGQTAAVRGAAVRGRLRRLEKWLAVLTHGHLGTPVTCSRFVGLIWAPGRAAVASCVDLLDTVSVVVDVFLRGLVSD